MPPDHSEVSGGGGGRGATKNVSSPSKTCHVYTMASAFSTFLRLQLFNIKSSLELCFVDIYCPGTAKASVSWHVNYALQGAK